jgi:3-phosphoshikimate 1-carboxyvinyltransferase
LEIKIKRSYLSGDILVPASKSHTIRALVIAGLAEGTSVLKNPLFSSDTESCIAGIRTMGSGVVVGENHVEVTGVGNAPAFSSQTIDMGNSGTSLRMLTGIATIGSQPVKFDGDDSLRTRPMQPLFTALEKLGAKVESTNGKCPFTIRGPIKGGKTEVNGMSSQYLSSLLIACPLIEQDTEIIVHQLMEKPYVEITLDWLKSQSIQFEQKGLDWFKIKGGQSYKPFSGYIPSDFSTATFPLCAAAVTRSEIKIKGLDFNDPQGDKEVFQHLEKMGVHLQHVEDGIIVTGGELTGSDIDMNNIPDALPAMAAVACYAKGTTRLINVAQARFKECDRIKAMATELKKMGADITELDDGLIIHESSLKGTCVHGYHDHRMVMALALAGMGAEGETLIDTAESFKITYPGFVKDFKHIQANIKY